MLDILHTLITAFKKGNLIRVTFVKIIYKGLNNA
jgi:hypothetical protein